MARCVVCRAKVTEHAAGWCPRCGEALTSAEPAWLLEPPVATSRSRYPRPRLRPRSMRARERRVWHTAAGIVILALLFVVAGVWAGSLEHSVAKTPELFPAYDAGAGAYGYIDRSGDMVVRPPPARLLRAG